MVGKSQYLIIDNIHNLILYKDNFLCGASEVSRKGVVTEDKVKKFLFWDTSWDWECSSHLTIDLDREVDRFHSDFTRICNRSRREDNVISMSCLFPELLCKYWCKRSKKLCDDSEMFRIYRFMIIDRIHSDHDLTDSGVEFVWFDIFSDFNNSIMNSSDDIIVVSIVEDLPL